MTKWQVAWAASYLHSGYHCGNSQDGGQTGHLQKDECLPLKVNIEETAVSCFVKTRHNPHCWWIFFFSSKLKKFNRHFFYIPNPLPVLVYSTKLFYSVLSPFSTRLMDLGVQVNNSMTNLMLILVYFNWRNEVLLQMVYSLLRSPGAVHWCVNHKS